MSGTLKAELRRRALSEGFDDVRVTAAAADPLLQDRLAHFISQGREGDMAWLADSAERRSSPQAMWPEARTAVMLAMRYGDGSDPLPWLAQTQRAVVSCYAQGADYHEVIKPKLKRLAGWLATAASADVKVFVDTAPLMEKPLAARAGLGWQGKHTNLVSRDLGSWFFLGAILTTAELPADEPETDHCGSCRRCLDICPTAAFPAPHQLDARRCISYLTIEHKGHIAQEFRKPMGNRVFGCDDCLAVCPWNKFAVAASEQRFYSRAEAANPPIAELLGLDDAAFRARFRGTPVKRTGRDRFLRNVLIAAGNSGDSSLVPQVEGLTADASPLVRAMAVWALAQLLPSDAWHKTRETLADRETDPYVRNEWGVASAKSAQPLTLSLSPKERGRLIR